MAKNDTSSEPQGAAKAAGLRYMSDTEPGFSRQRTHTAFRYLTPAGKAVRDPQTLARIRRLAIPPAWEDVWICTRDDGHLQATGRDARGRKQYRYHARWREVRDENKYGRMLAFAKALPRIRRRVSQDLALPGLPRDKVLATVVRLLETTRIRVGNEEYMRANDSFGLTTLRTRQVRVNGSTMSFNFRGKSGVQHRVALNDRKLSAIVRRMRDLPGYELFQYVDEAGETRAVDSADVNEYLKSIAGEEFTSKDFRTWAGTVLAALALREFERFDTEAAAKRNVKRAIEQVAQRLGNTPTICRKCYVHPGVLDCYLDGSLAEQVREEAEAELREAAAGLRPEEAAVLGLLIGRLARQEPRSARSDNAPSVRAAA
jgi:DNA topoisomerase I